MEIAQADKFILSLHPKRKINTKLTIMKKLLSFLALMLTICSTAMAETLTAESAVGTIGTLNGREAMVVDLGGSIGKVAVATRNVGAEKASDKMVSITFGTLFNLGKVNDPNENGLTDGWYVPSKAEMEALQKNLTPNKSLRCVEWKVTDNATLYLPSLDKKTGKGIYRGIYASSDREQEGETWKCWTYEFLFYENGTSFGGNDFEETDEQDTEDCAIRPFHKLPSEKNCRIYYTSSDGNVVEPNNGNFNVNIESNTYENGQGIITFSGELTSIGDDVFENNRTLTSISLPASVTSIGNNTFFTCCYLSSLTFAEGSQLETIGNYAFHTTAIAGKLSLPDSLKSIGNSAFANTHLTAVTIPASVTSIGNSAFTDTYELTTLTFAKDSQLETIGNNAFVGTAISGELTLPASLNSIGKEAFSGISELTSLTFAEGSQLESIGDNAFKGTAISGELTLPCSVKEMGELAFSSCPLTKVYMSSVDLSGIAENSFIESAVIIVPAKLHEAYKRKFTSNKVEVILEEWQEYTIAQIEVALKNVNTLSPTDKATIEGYIAGIRDAESFDEVCIIRDNALALIDQQKALEKNVKDALGDLGAGHSGPAIRVTGKNGKSIMLFELDKVEFVNIDAFAQGEAEATGIGNVRWIQLWEGGPKFAEYNLGATSATEFGGYYTWGGTYINGDGIAWDGTYNEGTSDL